MGVWTLPSATPDGPISLAANLEEEKGKVPLWVAAMSPALLGDLCIMSQEAIKGSSQADSLCDSAR